MERHVHFPSGIGYTLSPANGEYVLSLADVDELVRYDTEGAACAVIVPPNAEVAFPVGTRIWIEIGSPGSVEVRAASGVSLSRQITLTSRSQQAVIEKMATNTWHVAGLALEWADS